MYCFRQKLRHRLYMVIAWAIGACMGILGLLLWLLDWIFGLGTSEPKFLFYSILFCITSGSFFYWEIIHLVFKKPDILIDEKGIFFRNLFWGYTFIPWPVIGRVHAYHELMHTGRFGFPDHRTILEVYPKDHESCVRRDPKAPPIPPYNWRGKGPCYNYKLCRAPLADLPAIKAALYQRGGLRKK